MSVRAPQNQQNYSLNQPTTQHTFRPIIANRAPTTNDMAQFGQIWINKATLTVYMLAGTTNGAAQWKTSPASGLGTFTAVTVDPGNVHITSGNVTLDSGNVALTAGNMTIGGNLTVAGNSSFTGDIDFNSSALIDLVSTLNAAPSILLHANGGTSEQIYLHADQGTAVDSVLLGSDVGGITLTGGKAAATAINLTASNSAGGMTLTAGTGGVIANTTGEVSLNSATASNFTVTGAANLTLASTAGQVIVNSTDNAASCIYLHANGGTSETINIYADQGTGLSSINIHSDVGGISLDAGVANASAIHLNASNAAGGVNIGSGTAGTAISSTGAVAISAAANSSFSVTGAGVNLSLDSAGGKITISSEDNAAQALYLHANGGTSETIEVLASQGTGVASVNVHSTAGGVTVAGGLASANAINLTSSNAAGGMTFSAGTAGIAASSTGAVSLAGAANSSFNVTGASVNLSLNSAGGQVIIGSQDNAAQSIYLHANGGTSETIDIYADQGTGLSSINIHSDVGGINLNSGLANAAAIKLNASNAAGGVNIGSGTAGTAISSTGAFALSGAANSSLSVTGAGVNLSLDSAGGKVIVSSEDNAAQAIYLHANGGTSETIDIYADQGTSATSVNLHSDVGGITLNAGLATSDAINITASNAAGGIDVDAGTAGFIVDTTGAVSLDSATASNFTITGSADLTLSSSAGSLVIDGGESAVDAIYLHASNAGGGVTLTAGSSGFIINTAGVLSAVPATATSASPTASVSINANLGSATFTGFTTAAGSTQTFTINNSLVATTSALFVTVTNLGSNDAQMTMQRVKQASGSFEVYTKNNGAAALNGNVLISFWVYQP